MPRRHLKRVIRTARKTWSCVGCPDEIPPAQDYIQDDLVESTSYGKVVTVKTNRWHLWCAPYDRKDAEAVIESRDATSNEKFWATHKEI